MRAIIAAAALLVLLGGCTGPALSQDQALRVATDHLSSLNVPIENRRSSVSLEDDVYLVTYHLPEGWLGGDFLVKVSAEDGRVLDVTLWR